jgi:predicted transcriptional regulator of viral defense system
MPGSAHRSLFDLAAERFGYFTSSQAREWGVHPMALVMMARRNTAERVSHGVYRLAQFPISPIGHYMEAVLWPGKVRAALSHESVLALHGISDVSPAAIHVTVPPGFRTHRVVPAHLALHRGEVPDSDLDTFEGIPVTTFARAVRDCAAAHLSPELIRQAIEEGERGGLLDPSMALRLRSELLAG